MNLTVPLAVRVYNLPMGFDYHITKWVEDFSFRSTAPGGHASCILKFHYPRDLPVDPQQWGRLFTRVQIIDKRDAEILWEGRVEDPAQRSDADMWELGVLGSSVSATDVSIPFIYVDNTLTHWRAMEADAFDHTKEEINKSLTSRLNAGYVFAAGIQYGLWTWSGGSITGTSIARVTCTYNGTGPNSTQDDFFDQILNGSIYGNMDVTSFNEPGDFTKVNLMPNDAQFPDGLINQIYFDIRRNSSNYTVGASDSIIARFKNPKVQGIRVNRFGEPLLTAADYVHGDFVYVHQVVEDVIGRWLVGNWRQGPFLDDTSNLFECVGSVKGLDAYVDTSDATQITNLQFTDGVTAKDVLETLMTIQSNAYWAIWESDHLAGEQYGGMSANKVFGVNADDVRFRFEWATWPDTWNYLVTSQDGMDQQLSAEDCYSQIFVRHAYESSNEPFLSYSDPEGPWPAPGVVWDISETFQNQFDRVLFQDDSSTPLPSGVDSFERAFTEGAKHSLPVNAGTITVRRPIPCFDTGRNSSRSQMGILQPWEIRPGRLVMVRDLMPYTNSDNFERHEVVLNNNPTFEVDTSDWFGTGGTLTRVTSFRVSGDASGRIVPSGAAANVFMATGWKTMKAGETYRASAWIRCEVSRTVTLRIDFKDASGAHLSSATDARTIAADQWTYFEVNAVAPVNTAQGPMLAIMGGTPPSGHVMWLDEAYFSRVPRVPTGQRNTIFRVTATEYNLSDNSCKMELDALPKWSLPTQIANPGEGSNLSTR